MVPVIGGNKLYGTALIIAVFAVGCTPGAPSARDHLPPPQAPLLAPTSPDSVVKKTTVAEAVVRSVAIHGAAGDSVATQVLGHPRPSGPPLVFVVAGQKPGWLKVLLPVSPNGSTGWIDAASVRLSQHPYRISIDLSTRYMTVWDGGSVIEQGPVGIGKPETPTPAGLFFTTELLQPPRPDTAYGAYAYGLSGSSEVLTSFEGAEPTLGLHGTNDPSGLGGNVSAGCVRVDNEAITRLARLLPLGVPVDVRA